MLKQRPLTAGERQAVGEVLGELFSGQPGEGVANDEALRARRVPGHREPAPELGEADAEQAEASLGTHLVMGEQPPVVSQVMGLFDGEHRALLGFQGKVGELGAQDPIGAGAGVLESRPQCPGAGFVPVHEVAGGPGHVAEAIKARQPSGEAVRQKTEGPMPLWSGPTRNAGSRWLAPRVSAMAEIDSGCSEKTRVGI